MSLEFSIFFLDYDILQGVLDVLGVLLPDVRSFRQKKHMFQNVHRKL